MFLVVDELPQGMNEDNFFDGASIPRKTNVIKQLNENKVKA